MNISSSFVVKLVAYFCLLFFALSMIFRVVTKVSDEYETVEAVYTTQYESLDAKAFVIRDETLLFNSGGSTVVHEVKNAEKVTSNSVVAVSFNEAQSADDYNELTYLRRLLGGYEKIAKHIELANVDSDKLALQIDSVYDSIMEMNYEERYSEIADLKLDFIVDVSRRQISIGNPVDCSEKISSLNSEIAALTASSAPSGSILAGSDGYYVNSTDGYEDILRTADVEGLTIADVKRAFNSEPANPQTNCIGKIVDDFYWYLAVIISSDDSPKMTVGRNMKLVIGGDDTVTITAQVCSVTNDGDEALVVFRCNEMNEKTLSLRMTDVKIVLKEYSGILVPSKTLRVADGEKYVFVRRGNIVTKRYVNVIYTGDEYVIDGGVTEDSPAKKDAEYVKNHDEIIVNGKGLK